MRLALTASPGLQVGKTTLIKSLVKHYTRHNISAVKGPVTVVSGKHRRLQFVECGGELTQMVRFQLLSLAMQAAADAAL